MVIKSLEGVGFDAIYNAFSQAFSDYAIRFDKNEVRSMLVRRGFNPELSFAAFHNDEIVAFTFNGTGTFNGVSTAYDTGTGTLKPYRGKGIAREIFLHSLPCLRERGVRQYLLEVLQDNGAAISVYRNLGFKTTREFMCFRQQRELVNNGTDAGCASSVRIGPVSVADIAGGCAFVDFSPSWQNSWESIVRAGTELTCFGAFLSDKMVGYCVFDATTGDLSQIAVAPGYRRRGIGSRLLCEFVRHTDCAAIKVLNICSTDNTLPAFLAAKNILPASGQYEMILPL